MRSCFTAGTIATGGAVALAIAAVAGILIATSGAGGVVASSEAALLDSYAGGAIPGARSTLVTSSRSGGKELVVTLPADAVGEPPDRPQVQVAHLGWLTGLIASSAASDQPDLTDFATRESDGSTPPGSANFWEGAVRLSPGSDLSSESSSLDGVTTDVALRQTDANLAVLRNGLGELLVSDHAGIVSIDPKANRFAVTVDLQVTRMSDVTRFFGDIFDGLATGLVGGTDPLIEGMAIRVTDADGLAAGVWRLPRIGLGSGAFDPSIEVPDVRPLTMDFTSLTGTNPPAGSASGGVGRLPHGE